MKIYLSHNFTAREYLKDNIVPLLESLGHEITSTWVNSTRVHMTESNNPKEDALKDIEDILVADMIIFFTDQFGDTPGRGKYFELGYAYSSLKKIILCGENVKDCVFYFLSEMRIAPTLTDLILMLKNA